jgi:hypothetical protein
VRTQRRPPVTVRLVRANRTVDKYGNGSRDPKVCVVDNALFEPDEPVERASDDQVPVLEFGHWNIPGRHTLVANDSIKAGADTWQVVGGGVIWLNRTKVRVQRARRQ